MLSMFDVDRVSCLLPKEVKMNWQRRYRELPPEITLKPFTEFVNFLKIERSVVARLAEVTPSVKKPRKPLFTDTHSIQAEKKQFDKSNKSKPSCIVHGQGHHTLGKRMRHATGGNTVALWLQERQTRHSAVSRNT